MLNIGLVGANGRMGKAVAIQISNKPNQFNLKCAIVNNINNIDNEIKHIAQTCSDSFTMLKDVDVVIDFSEAKNCVALLSYCLENKLPLVIGTTGFNEEEQKIIKHSALKIPVLHAPNTSLSVNVLFKAAEFIAKKLEHFEVEITEAHHRYKKDSPSGTAIKLGETIANARGINLSECAKYNRFGVNEVRKSNEIGFSVIRGGDIIGMHDVQFISDGEILSLKSQINNRASFANGALLAAQFLYNKPAGLYSMSDVLEL
jgi:4-hydroxy-tetrahydrodipicolinate reductase